MVEIMMILWVFIEGEFREYSDGSLTNLMMYVNEFTVGTEWKITDNVTEVTVRQGVVK